MLPSHEELEILRLVNRYAQLATGQQVEPWVELFTEQGIWERKKGASHGKYTETVRVQGRAELKAFAAASFAGQGGERYQYVAGNTIVGGEGAAATGTSTTFIIGMDAQRTGLILVGNFEDRYEKTANGWRFAYRGMSVMS